MRLPGKNVTAPWLQLGGPWLNQKVRWAFACKQCAQRLGEVSAFLFGHPVQKTGTIGIGAGFRFDDEAMDERALPGG
jgi:hypothetical protein